jgi:flagellar basal-body rod modification protein FlgD
VSKTIFARANPRLNPRAHAFHQHTDFKRHRPPSGRGQREKAEFLMTVSATSSATTATTTTSSSSSSSNSTLTSSDFLSLLVSELQNQDPLNATSTTDLINQLTSYANFSSQQSINSNLSSLAGSFSSLVTLNSVNYIGHTVEAKTDTSTLSNGSATFGYSLSSAASNVSISISDSSGNVVYTGTGTGNSGSNSFTWDGKDSSGNQLSDGGQYTISVTATNSSGNSVLNYTTVTGTVTGIDTSTSTPSLTVNGVSVSAANILGVTS